MRGYYKIGEKELLFEKGRWNRGKRVLIYLLGSDAGMPYAAISRRLGDLNSSSIGRVYKKVAEEIEGGRKTRRDVLEIRKKYAME